MFRTLALAMALLRRVCGCPVRHPRWRCEQAVVDSTAALLYALVHPWTVEIGSLATATATAVIAPIGVTA
jgi:hypothetical protein